MPKALSDYQRQLAIEIGARMWGEAKLRPGGVSGFQKELKAAGAPGISTRKELYAKLGGRSMSSPKLIKIASTILGVRRQWLARGTEPKEPGAVLDPALLERRRSTLRELTNAFSRHVERPAAAAMAQAVVEHTDLLEVGELFQANSWPEWRSLMVSYLAELVEIAPHLRPPEEIAEVTDHLISLHAHHHIVMGIVRVYGGGNRQTNQSWGVLWECIRNSATSYLDASGTPIPLPPEIKKEIRDHAI